MIRTFVSVIAILLPLVGWAQTGSVIRDGKEWLQPSGFLNYTWEEVNAVCSDGVCNGLLPGSNFNLTGYIWASVDEVNSLFNSYAPPEPLGPGRDGCCPRKVGEASPGTPAGRALLRDFQPTSDVEFNDSSGIRVRVSEVRALTRSLTPPEFDLNATLGPSVIIGEAVVTFDDEFPDGDGGLGTTDVQRLNVPGEEVGLWLFRPLASATVSPLSPVPEIANSAVSESSCRRGDSVTVVKDSIESACAIAAGEVATEADLFNASIKVIASSPGGKGFREATASLVDLVTVTRGFDSEGRMKGKLEVEWDGFIDASDVSNLGLAKILAVVWYPDQEPLDCFNSFDECGISQGPYEFVAQAYDVFLGVVLSTYEASDNVRGVLRSNDSSNPSFMASIPFEVTRDAPSFYVGIYASAAIPQRAPGNVDFFNTIKNRITGNASDFLYSSKNGFGRGLPGAQHSSEPVRLWGNVRGANGGPINAMVLASGRYMFSRDSQGRFDLNNLPRDQGGNVRRQIYASGFTPQIDVVRSSASEVVRLEPAGQCPSYNPVSVPAARAQSAGQQHTISGRVFVQDSADPVRAMVLVNGQFDFADAEGRYQVTFPLDSQGQFTRQVYASGFAPSIEKYDASTTSLVVRLARSSECN